MLRRITHPSPGDEPIRADGWENSVTGFGTAGRDKTESAQFVPDPVLSWQVLSALYYGDDLAARMINARVEEGFREGYCLAADNVEQAEEFDEWCTSTHLTNSDATSKIEHAETWGPLFGGALILIGTNDADDLSTLMNEDRVSAILWVTVVDRRNAIPESYYTELGPKLGQVATYRITVQTPQSTQSFIVHESRAVRVGSVLTDVIASRRYSGWDQPMLVRPYKVIRDFAAMHQGIGLMITDASQGVFSMKGLWEKLASKGAKDFIDRMSLVDMGRSIARSVVVDSDGESFTKVATSFAGLPEIHDRFQQRLSASCGIPVSVLFGRSAAGMNATGDNDMESWGATVRSYQRKSVTPRLRRLYRILALDKSSPSGGKPIEGLGVTWSPLRIPSDLDAANAYNTRAQGDAVYIDRNVFAAQEVAIARAGRGEYSGDVPKVDVERLQKELDDPATFAPPPPPAPIVLGPDGKPVQAPPPPPGVEVDPKAPTPGTPEEQGNELQRAP